MQFQESRPGWASNNSGPHVHSRGWSRECIKSECGGLNHLKRLASLVFLCGRLRNPSWELDQNESISTTFKLSEEEVLGVTLQCIQDPVELRKSRGGSEVAAGETQSQNQGPLSPIIDYLIDINHMRLRTLLQASVLGAVPVRRCIINIDVRRYTPSLRAHYCPHVRNRSDN